MNVRKSLYVVISAVLVIPVAALADAPSGDFDQTHGITFSSSADPAVSNADRRENRNYVEVAVEQLIGKSTKSREEVKSEMAASPMPRIEA